ncbi:MAG TPA: hypothetical protein VE010_17495, partial [Thermoanaerobaculia bacterium]|nr:hypothetical protein [Thermoanaerobaculia bacterium]
MRTRLLAALVLTAAATTLAAADRLDSYVYKRPDGTSIMRINGSLGDIKSIAKRYGNEFIWAKEGNRQYVVKDAGVLAEARTVFAKLDA